MLVSLQYHKPVQILLMLILLIVGTKKCSFGGGFQLHKDYAMICGNWSTDGTAEMDTYTFRERSDPLSLRFFITRGTYAMNINNPKFSYFKHTHTHSFTSHLNQCHRMTIIHESLNSAL
jgi:hypothetical protein